jgi:hypothetical protein
LSPTTHESEMNGRSRRSHRSFISAFYGGDQGERRSLVRRRRFALMAAVIVGVAALSAGFAIAARGDGDKPLTGTALEKATAAALAHARGGTVTETEVGDDGAAYSVEIRRDDGTEIEVNLDEQFSVVGQEVDDDGAGEVDEDGAGE